MGSALGLSVVVLRDFVATLRGSTPRLPSKNRDMATKYYELVDNPPTLSVVEGAREVVVHLVSVMCDNRYLWTLKKDNSGGFKVNTHAQAFGNFCVKAHKHEIEWAADEGKWDEVFAMISEGTCVIERVQSR